MLKSVAYGAWSPFPGRCRNEMRVSKPEDRRATSQICCNRCNIESHWIAWTGGKVACCVIPVVQQGHSGIQIRETRPKRQCFGGHLGQQVFDRLDSTSIARHNCFVSTILLLDCLDTFSIGFLSRYICVHCEKNTDGCGRQHGQQQHRNDCQRNSVTTH